MSNQIRRLVRSNSERMISGVCGGLGLFFGIDPTIVRLTFVFTTLLWPFIPLVYLIMVIVVPEETTGSLRHFSNEPDASPPVLE